ncbi:DUF2691 family protein [Caproiciproducens sp. R1]|uniref:DUF2691 family protein n=1 Tax=Caproiciproducens sp. R1 TaxID=3435000 RepID=UPI004033D4D0
MIRGVSFNVLPCDNTLYQIFKCIDVEKYCWYNIDSQNEAWNNPQGTPFFETDYYDGKSFLRHIISDHFIIFLKLQAYFKNGSFFDIHSYKEFDKSDCQLLLLIYDSQSVEIYAKDQILIKDIYENALANYYTKIQYITESNDGRTTMDVL